MKLSTCLLIISIMIAPLSQVLGESGSDIDGHWAKDELQQWIEKGLLNGYGDGNYLPNQTITRAEAATLVNRSFEHEETAEVAFSDVTAEDWFYENVSKAIAAGFMTGYEDGTFKPDQNITRQELAAMIFRLLGLDANTDAVASYDDVDSISDWAKGEIGALVDLGIVTGYNDNTIQPNGLTKRSEAIVMIERAFEYLYTYSEAGAYGPEEGTETITHDVTVTTSDVTLQNLVIEGDLLLAEGIGEGDVYLNNVTVNGTTTILGGGENSVHLTDTVLITVIVDKKDGNIRIVVKGESEVKEVTLNSGAKLVESELDGVGFADVVISTEIVKDANVELEGEFESVDVYAEDILVEVSENSSVEKLVLNAVIKVVSEGNLVETIENVSGSEIEQANDSEPSSSGGGSGGGTGSTDDESDEENLAILSAEIEIESESNEKESFQLEIDGDEILVGIPEKYTNLPDDEEITLKITIKSTKDVDTMMIDFKQRGKKYATFEDATAELNVTVTGEQVGIIDIVDGTNLATFDGYIEGSTSQKDIEMTIYIEL
ncbi:S-layer homology domain-containing protein [Chengkuizengella axinellae]|uniref:S-layer homology domain-containing protein n=1 Tax=Chengkuizengella axinellae TaxID=3064388 RepID=A0ABT9J4R8_9BACL|nr:S-layer homology domain-containing protein [Chengkuizengella sp. 2205SS18-9]MDP5276616.1 S-layer homology domain-containing protein [Chengkuizengella sp. 2205SS18-9]